MRPPSLPKPFGDPKLANKTPLETRDSVGVSQFGILKTKLYMVEPNRPKPRNSRFAEPNTRSDQVGIQPDVGRVLDKFLKVGARCRLTTGEMHVEHAEIDRLV